MAFTKFDLPNKAPDAHCNARVRLDGAEAYCPVATQETRCPAHNGSSVQKARAEKAKQAIATSKTLRDRTEWWMEYGDAWYAKSRFLSVDRHLLLLATLIHELGNRKPLAGMTEQEVEHLAKLIRSYSELSLARVETALKLWDKMSEQGMGTERFENYVWLLILEMGMAYDVDIKEMMAAEKAKKVQAQQTSTTLPNGSTQVQTA